MKTNTELISSILGLAGCVNESVPREFIQLTQLHIGSHLPHCQDRLAARLAHHFLADDAQVGAGDFAPRLRNFTLDRDGARFDLGAGNLRAMGCAVPHGVIAPLAGLGAGTLCQRSHRQVPTWQ